MYPSTNTWSGSGDKMNPSTEDTTIITTTMPFMSNINFYNTRQAMFDQSDQIFETMFAQSDQVYEKQHE